MNSNAHNGWKPETYEWEEDGDHYFCTPEPNNQLLIKRAYGCYGPCRTITIKTPNGFIDMMDGSQCCTIEWPDDDRSKVVAEAMWEAYREARDHNDSGRYITQSLDRETKTTKEVEL